MVSVCFRGAENHDVAVSHRFQDKGRLKNRSHQTFLDEWGSQGFLGGSGALRGHRTFEKAFLGGPTSWTTTDEKVLYSDKSRNCGKGTGKGKGKGQGKGVDALLEGTLKILFICMAVSCLFPGQGDQGSFPQAELRPGKLPTSRTATWGRPRPRPFVCAFGRADLRLWRRLWPRGGSGGGSGLAAAPAALADPRPLFGQKTPKRTGVTRLGFPGLSSHSVSGFSRPFSARKPQNGLG